MFQRILVSTDLNDGLQRLVHFAACFAAAGVKQLVFLHVMPVLDDREIPRPDPEKMQKARDQLSMALENIPDGLDVKVEVKSGRPVDHIMSTVKTYSSEVVFLGMPSRSRLTEKLFGSTSMDLCRQIRVPLMILRPQLISTYTREELELRCQHLFQYLLVPYDGSNAAKFLIEQVEHFAKNPHNTLKQVLVCRIIDEVSRQDLMPYLESQVKGAQEMLAGVKANLESLNIQVETLVRQGSPVNEVLLLAQNYDISAIALSSDSLGKILEWSIPSFAGEILRQSWHPVLYFPPQK